MYIKNYYIKIALSYTKALFLRDSGNRFFSCQKLITILTQHFELRTALRFVFPTF